MATPRRPERAHGRASAPRLSRSPRTAKDPPLHRSPLRPRPPPRRIRARRRRRPETPLEPPRHLAIVGAATPTASVGDANIPQSVVPHPDTYDKYPDIDVELIDAFQFHSLWTEAVALYGDF